MKHGFLFVITIISGCLVLFSQCSIDPLASGNSSQTGNNGVIITAMNQSLSGITRCYVHVAIYDKRYLPYSDTAGFTMSTKTNDSGYFEFSHLPYGYYNLFVIDSTKMEMAFISDVPILEDKTVTDTLADLHRPGFLAGIAIDSSGMPIELSYVFIQGSPFYAVTRKYGDFRFDPLPSGNYTLNLFLNVKKLNDDMVLVMLPAKTSSSVLIKPDSTTEIHLH
jgi:hypothetical protein